MNGAGAKATPDQRKRLEPLAPRPPTPQLATTPQPTTELAALQAGVGNATLATAGTGGTLTPASGLLPLQSTFGNAAAARVAMEPRAQGRAKRIGTPLEPLEPATTAPHDKLEQEADQVAELTGNDNGSIPPSAAAQSRSAVGSLQRLYGNQAVLQMRHGSGGLPASSVPLRPSQSGIVQRKCACGGAAGMSGECEECSKKQRLGLQTKLKVNEPGDIYEQEADRIADQVMAAPADPAVSGASPRIQRFSGQSNGQMDAAPASVDYALASPGRPLEPVLQRDMEQRFGYDFSRVRVHSGADAEQSARDVNANAYTMGHDIVFGAGRFAPGTHQGRRLIAHELTHVVQQSGSDGIRLDQGDEKRGLSPIPPIPAPVRQQSASGSRVQRQREPGAGTITEPRTEERRAPPPAGGEPEAAREAGLSPEVARRISYAATVLRRITPLPEEDRASLDQIIPGTEIYKRIKQRDALREQLNTTLEVITSLETRNPDPDLPMEHLHVMEGLHTTAARLTAEVERLDIQIEVELAELGTDEAGLVELVKERFPRIWERRAKEIAYTMLDENEEVAKYERERYSKLVCSPDTVGLKEADRRLAEFYQGISAEEDALNRAAAYRSTIAAGVEPRTAEELGIPAHEESLIVYVYRFDEYQEALEQRKAKYEAERAALIPEFPILGAKGYVPGVFSEAPEEDLAKVTGEPIEKILENIEDTRENIEDDTIRVWDLDDIPALAFHELGVAEDSVLGDAVWSYIEDKKSDESWLNIALAAIGLVAGLVAAFATGGLALVAGGIVLATSGVILYRSASLYGAESAAENVALDPVIADISVNEPELLWVVFDVVGLGLGVGDIVRLLRPFARTALRTGELAVFERAARRWAPEAADRLIASAGRRTVGRAAGAAAGLAEREVAEMAVGTTVVRTAGREVQVTRNGLIWLCSPWCDMLRAAFERNSVDLAERIGDEGMLEFGHRISTLEAFSERAAKVGQVTPEFSKRIKEAAATIHNEIDEALRLPPPRPLEAGGLSRLGEEVSAEDWTRFHPDDPLLGQLLAQRGTWMHKEAYRFISKAGNFPKNTLFTENTLPQLQKIVGRPLPFRPSTGPDLYVLHHPTRTIFVADMTRVAGRPGHVAKSLGDIERLETALQGSGWIVSRVPIEPVWVGIRTGEEFGQAVAGLLRPFAATP